MPNHYFNILGKLGQITKPKLDKEYVDYIKKNSILIENLFKLSLDCVFEISSVIKIDWVLVNKDKKIDNFPIRLMYNDEVLEMVKKNKHIKRLRYLSFVLKLNIVPVIIFDKNKIYPYFYYSIEENGISYYGILE